MTPNNVALASLIFLANLTVSGVAVSLAIALTSLVIGKFLDWYVKPWVMARRDRKRTAKLNQLYRWELTAEQKLRENTMKDFLRRTYAQIPEPTRSILLLALFGTLIFLLADLGDSTFRTIDRALFNRQVAPVTKQAEAAHAASVTHEAAADAATAEHTELEARRQEIEARITTHSKLRERTRAAAETSRRKLHAIRQTPVDNARAVDDVRRHSELRAILIAQYPELLGESGARTGASNPR